MVDLLKAALSGHTVVFASTGVGALHQLVREKPELVLLDLKLPDIDGLMLVGKIRALSQVPVITLSARNEQSDVVMALQAGADDCIRKPFDLDNLEARICAVLRRANRPRIRPPIDYDAAIRPLRLSHNERFLLTLLLQARGEVVTVSDLAGPLWNTPNEDRTRDMTTLIGRLRGHLRTAGWPTIVTVRGQGYLFPEA